MVKRFRRTAAVLALLALAVLLFRPALLDLAGAPNGAHFSPEVQMAYADDSPHCGLLADCEMVSIANVGLALVAGLVVLPAGALLSLTIPGFRTMRSWTAPVPNQPPLSALS